VGIICLFYFIWNRNTKKYQNNPIARRAILIVTTFFLLFGFIMSLLTNTFGNRIKKQNVESFDSFERTESSQSAPKIAPNTLNANIQTQSNTASSSSVSNSNASNSSSITESSLPSVSAFSDYIAIPQTKQRSYNYHVTLYPGFYKVGTDIPDGNYDFIVENGNGQLLVGPKVFCMGTKQGIIYKTGIRLQKNVEITVSQCAISAYSNVDTNQVFKRKVKRTVQLNSGEYIVGSQIQSGIVTFVAKSGSGQVQIQGKNIDLQENLSAAMWNKKIENINLEKGTSIKITGLKIIEVCY
jgi:hypothetical protein